MIPVTLADEYPLRLSTGETIQVAEIDAERSPALAIPQIRKSIESLLKHCCLVPREIVEEAKGGYDTRLKPLLRSQPRGCMIKTEKPICLHIESCSMASKPICTLHNCAPSSTPLPICWEFSPPPMAHLEARTATIDLGTLIGHAWRLGKYVFIVDF